MSNSDDSNTFFKFLFTFAIGLGLFYYFFGDYFMMMFQIGRLFGG
ncbi:MAG: hypothetical protein N2C14_00140 [Planctomycetales bacterium]